MINKITLALLLMLFTFQIQAQCWKTMDGGHMFSIAIKDDGTLWGWGSNSNGELGAGNTPYKLMPTKIGTESNWSSVSAGYYHTVAIKKDGSLWTWGNNRQGQLGLGTSVSEYYEPQRVGTENNWKSVSAGSHHTMAIKNNGTLWGWGENREGQLGDGTRISKNIPTFIDINWTMVEANAMNTLAIDDGVIWKWGNFYSKFETATPEIFGDDSDWKSIASTGSHSMALKNDNSLWAWGENGKGELGDGTNIQRKIPIKVGNSTNWESVSVGINSTKAIKNDGSLWVWGMNNNGQLGDGTNIDKNTPTQLGSSTEWKNIFSGLEHTLAVKKNGSLWSWGFNFNGQLGDGTLTDRNIPVQITPPCIPLSVSDTHQSALQIFPNPSKDYFSINTKDVKQVQLYSLDGKLIKEYTPSDKYTIRGIVKGIYILKITDSKEVRSIYKLKIID